MRESARLGNETGPMLYGAQPCDFLSGTPFFLTYPKGIRVDLARNHDGTESEYPLEIEMPIDEARSSLLGVDSGVMMRIG